MDSQVSMSREVSVFLLLVMVMHPYRWSLKVSMASSLSATVYEVTISSRPCRFLMVSHP